MSFCNNILQKTPKRTIKTVFREYLRQGRGRSLKIREEHTGRHNDTSSTPAVGLTSIL